MRFYTEQECTGWLADRNRQRPDVSPALLRHRIKYPTEPHRFFFAAHWVSSSLTYRAPALLWITEWGIWPSSENWHLYYKLRQSHCDHHLLGEMPGHLFLEYEVEELTSFLQLSMLNGWGGYLLTQSNYVNAFFSHDEYIDFYSDQQKQLDDVAKALGK